MDVEFHYYMTYLIAAKAGFGPEDAFTIANACQYVDDNDMILEIDKGKASAYRNYISQTMNILKPKAKLFRIYPLFHFIPGDPKNSTAWRKDGKMHWLNTTPDSENANRIFDAALATKDLYRIGVACHAYADTWAHQNFVGYYEPFNAMDDPLDQVTPNIGHADAGHNPDWPALVWQDRRLCKERVDNKATFLDAAEHMLRKLMRYADSAACGTAVAEMAAELRQDLDWAIGDRDQSNSFKEERIARYRQLSNQAEYGGRELVQYDGDLWLEEAINENVRGLRDRGDFTLARWDPLTDEYTWKDRQNYGQVPWYRFQEAVKGHQEESWRILSKTNLRGLDLAVW
jgi:hypothetical protein